MACATLRRTAVQIEIAPQRLSRINPVSVHATAHASAEKRKANVERMTWHALSACPSSDAWLPTEARSDGQQAHRPPALVLARSLPGLAAALAASLFHLSLLRPLSEPLLLSLSALLQPANKSMAVKKTLAKKMNQNRPIPQWIRMRTGNRIRYAPPPSDARDAPQGCTGRQRKLLLACAEYKGEAPAAARVCGCGRARCCRLAGSNTGRMLICYQTNSAVGMW